ncbi:MAG: DNA polymerase III subunit gamma/tau [Opitutaceae bacterium]
MPAAAPWPTRLAGTPAVAVIEQAIARQRLSHSLLLQGEDLTVLTQVALAIADRLLNPPGASGNFPPETHPDCFHLRPTGRARMIRIGDDARSPATMREFIARLTVSPAVATRKVGIVHEADRMNTESANAFLKTLEEPPGHSTLLLLTTRPHALLPTIRSRVLTFRFPGAGAPIAADGWEAWLSDYKAWLERLVGGVGGDRQAVAAQIMGLYGLVARFGAVLDFATAEIWKQRKATLPEELSEDESVAIETGIANGLRTRLLAEVERATRDFAQPRLAAGDEHVRRALVAAVGELEHHGGLLRLNLNESTALEGFLLASLRIWSRR